MPAGDTDDQQTRRAFDSADLDTPKLGGGTRARGPGVEDAGRGRTLHLLRPDATSAEIEDLVRRIRGDSDPE